MSAMSGMSGGGLNLGGDDASGPPWRTVRRIGAGAPSVATVRVSHRLRYEPGTILTTVTDVPVDLCADASGLDTAADMKAIGGGIKTARTIASVIGTASTVATVVAPEVAEAAAFGISTAIGSAIPIPLLGSAIGAIVGAFTALGIWLSDQVGDSFHPDAGGALGWLLLFQIAPGLVYGNVDEINTETGQAADKAARLVRYFRLISGIVKNRGNAPLYNPMDTSSRSNPYIESKIPDPGEQLTNVHVTQMVGNQVRANGHRPANPAIRSMLRRPIEAQHALKLLRGKQFANSGVLSWSILNAQTMADLRASIAKTRALAGESGADPYLAKLFGGPVTVPVRHVAKVAQRWAVGHDGVTLARVGPPVPATPAHVAQAQADRQRSATQHPGAVLNASPGPYKPGSVVFLGGAWYRINALGRPTPAGLLKPQPPPPPARQVVPQILAARQVAHPPLPRPKANVLPSQLGTVMSSLGSIAKVASSTTSALKTGSDVLSSLGGVVSSLGGMFDAMGPEMGPTEDLGALGSVNPPWSTALAIAGQIGDSVWAAADGPLAEGAVGDSLGEDDIHMTAAHAESLLRLYRTDPGLLFAGNDLRSPDEAARLVRYLKLVSGEHPMRATWRLYGPRDAAVDNPYQNTIDPTDPLTDARYLTSIHDVLTATKLNAHLHAGTPLALTRAVVSPDTAKRLLEILRHPLVLSGLRDAPAVAGNLVDICAEIKRVRRIAGEHGADPVLAKVFGDVTVP